MSDPIGLRATGALHCNLNVSTLAGAVGVYESLGLRVKMRSRAEGQDATAMGLGDSTTSEAWFLYDIRGGRGAPAVELVEWMDRGLWPFACCLAWLLAWHQGRAYPTNVQRIGKSAGSSLISTCEIAGRPRRRFSICAVSCALTASSMPGAWRVMLAM